MELCIVLALVLAAFWGTLWALFLQLTALGKFLVRRHTWMTVVVGTGFNLAILFLILSPIQIAYTFGVFAASGIPIIIRSLCNEKGELDDLIEQVRDGN